MYYVLRMDEQSCACQSLNLPLGLEGGFFEHNESEELSTLHFRYLMPRSLSARW